MNAFIALSMLAVASISPERVELVRHAILAAPLAELPSVARQLVWVAPPNERNVVRGIVLHVMTKERPGLLKLISDTVPPANRPPVTPGNEHGNRPEVPPGLQNYAQP